LPVAEDGMHGVAAKRVKNKRLMLN
jgi:hypothetical protein